MACNSCEQEYVVLLSRCFEAYSQQYYSTHLSKSIEINIHFSILMVQFKYKNITELSTLFALYEHSNRNLHYNIN